MEAAITLTHLIDKYLAWLEREVAAGRRKPGTLKYYAWHLRLFADGGRGERPVADLIPWDLEAWKTNWHSVQTVQRLFAWAARLGLVQENIFVGIERPDLGERERVLSMVEAARLLRAASRPLRQLLLYMRGTLCRPTEARMLQWSDWRPEVGVFVLKDFKGKRRRKDKKKYRVLMLPPRIRRLIERLYRRAQRDQAAAVPSGAVFLNTRQLAWTCSAICNAMETARRRAGIDPGEENVVAYTFRHTSATTATANGITDRVLGELLGHANPRMTARYQHLQVEHLRPAIEQATRRPDRRRPA